MNEKRVVRINENQLKQIVMESVKRVLKENVGHEFDMYGVNNINVESIREIYEIARDAFGISGGEQKAIIIDFHCQGKIIELNATNVPDGVRERYYSIKLKVWDEGEEKPYNYSRLVSSNKGYDFDYPTLEKEIKSFILSNET